MKTLYQVAHIDIAIIENDGRWLVEWRDNKTVDAEHMFFSDLKKANKQISEWIGKAVMIAYQRADIAESNYYHGFNTDSCLILRDKERTI